MLEAAKQWLGTPWLHGLILVLLLVMVFWLWVDSMTEGYGVAPGKGEGRSQSQAINLTASRKSIPDHTGANSVSLEERWASGNEEETARADLEYAMFVDDTTGDPDAAAQYRANIAELQEMMQQLLKKNASSGSDMNDAESFKGGLPPPVNYPPTVGLTKSQMAYADSIAHRFAVEEKNRLKSGAKHHTEDRLAQTLHGYGA